MSFRKVSLLLLAWLSLSVAAAEEAQSDRFKPSGPVRINADKAEWQKGGEMIYRGNVRLESGLLSLSGESLTLQQKPDGQFVARVIGQPAALDHAADPDGPVETREAIAARSSELIYRSSSDTVEIVGDASLQRGTDVITGHRVRYEVKQRRVQAAGKVQIVIQPPDNGGSEAESLPSLTPAIPDSESEGS